MRLQRLAIWILLLAASKLNAQYTINSIAGGVPANASALKVAIGNPQGVAIGADGSVYFSDQFLAVVFRLNAGNVTLVAGTGISGYSGDGGPATKAQLAGPAGLFLDSAGNLYIADFSNTVCAIRKVDTSGKINTVAGNGLCGYSGDGNVATSAELNRPSGVAVDSAGDTFIADSWNCRIRKVVAATGNIQTVAGNGTCAYSGDGSAATQAELYTPSGVALDSAGDVFIADYGNNRIREVTIANGNINTVAGNGTGGYSGDGGPATQAELYVPAAVALDGKGDLFIADYGNTRIREVLASDHYIVTVAGNGTYGYTGDGGPATSAELNGPEAVGVDGSGNLFIGDTFNSVIREVTAANSFIHTIAGNGFWSYSGDGGPAIQAELYNPGGVALSGADLYIADTGNNVIREVTADGKIQTIAGTGKSGYSGDGGPATNAQLNLPEGVFVDNSGNVFIADTGNCVVREVNTSGFISTVIGDGTCGYTGDGGPAKQAQLQEPYYVSVDGQGNMYVVDTFHQVIRKVLASTGNISTIVPSASGAFVLDASGNLYYPNSCEIDEKTSSGIVSLAGGAMCGYSGDGGPPTNAQLNYPGGVALDTAGDVIIADTSNYTIRQVSVPTSGTPKNIQTVAGDDSPGFAGDDGPARLAEIDQVQPLDSDAGAALVWDSISGQVIFADTSNSRIRAFTPQVTSCQAPTRTQSGFTVNASISCTGYFVPNNDKQHMGFVWGDGHVSGSNVPGCDSNCTFPASNTYASSGKYGVSPTVTDASGTDIITVGFTVNIPSTFAITPTTLPNGTVGTAYSQQQLNTSGGTAPITWSIPQGNLPNGLNLGASSGIISGTPTAAGTFNFTVQAEDKDYDVASQTLSIVVAWPTLMIATQSLPGGTVGKAYSQTLTASGGSGTYTWTISSGSLPAGLTLSATGGISGTPTTAGTANFTVMVTDTSNDKATKALSVAVASPTLTVTTQSLPGGTVGTAYSQTLTASGGSGTYTWTISSGSLPAGLTLSTAGVISGTPTTAGTANFTVMVTDTSNDTATKALSVAVPSSTLTVTTQSLPGGTVGTAYSQTLTASGGSGTYTWTISSGSLPAGVTLSTAGVISGTPTTAGTANFTVMVTDTSNNTATKTLSLQITSGATGGPVCQPPTVSPQGASSPLQVMASTNCTDSQSTIASTTINWGDGSAPSSAANGSHTYASAGTYTITVTATDAANASTSASEDIALGASVSVTQGGTAQESVKVMAPPGSSSVQVTYTCASADGPSGVQSLSSYKLSCNINNNGASATVTLTGTAAPLSISVQTTSNSQSGMMRRAAGGALYAMLFFLPGTLLMSVGGVGVPRRRKSVVGLGCLLFLVLLSGLFGCGGGSTSSTSTGPPPQTGTPTGSYTIEVTGTNSGATQSTVIVGLTVN